MCRVHSAGVPAVRSSLLLDIKQMSLPSASSHKQNRHAAENVATTKHTNTLSFCLFEKQIAARGLILTGENLKDPEKNLFQCQSVHHKHKVERYGGRGERKRASVIRSRD